MGWVSLSETKKYHNMAKHPPMAQFDGIIINVWKNRKVHLDEKAHVLNFP